MLTTLASEMEQILEFASDNAFWVIGGGVALVAIVSAYIKDIVKIRSQERTRREIAAYIAEGSMTPEQGERLMRAGSSDEEA